MSMESLYKLSIMVSLIDQFSGPSTSINRALDSTSTAAKIFRVDLAKIARDSTLLVGTGEEIVEGAIAPVKSIFGTQNALAELSSLSVEHLSAVKNAAKQFTSVWAGTNKAEFISAAYDIKSGYDDLSDIEFWEMFSGAISQSVKQFKTTGSGMAQAISALGGSATQANVPMEERRQKLI